jgi:hypothetical protein
VLRALFFEYGCPAKTMQMASPVGTHVFKFKTNLILNTLPGNDADGLGLSRKRTIYMLKIGAKVSNRSVGRKDAIFRGFC